MTYTAGTFRDVAIFDGRSRRQGKPRWLIVGAGVMGLGVAASACVTGAVAVTSTMVSSFTASPAMRTEETVRPKSILLASALDTLTQTMDSSRPAPAPTAQDLFPPRPVDPVPAPVAVTSSLAQPTPAPADSLAADTPFAPADSSKPLSGPVLAYADPAPETAAPDLIPLPPTRSADTAPLAPELNIPLPPANPLKRAPGPLLAYAPPEQPRINKAPVGNDTVALPRAGSRVAIYDIAAHTVYLPNGDTLEAHSGLGSRLDDPGSVRERDRGATPPHTYDLTLREQLFHGVQALRLTPADGGGVYGRTGLLAHTYMLGPRGDSNGCVSFKDYRRFLRAYQSGEIAQLVVVPRMSDASARIAAARSGQSSWFAWLR